MPRNRALTLLGTLFAGLAIGLVAWWSSHGFPTSDRNTPARDQEQTKASGTLSRSADERSPGDDIHRDTVALDPAVAEAPDQLTQPELDRLAARWQDSAMTYSQLASELMALPETELTLERLAKHARLIRLREISLEAVRQIRAGRCHVIGSVHPQPEIPEGYSMVETSPFQLDSGASVRIGIVVNCSTASIVAATDAEADCRRASDEEYLGMFNNLDYDERERRWTQQLRILGELKALRADRLVKHDEKAKRVDELESRLIPSHFAIDRAFRLRLR